MDTKKGNCMALATVFSAVALKAELNVELLTCEHGIHFFNKIIDENNEYY